MRVNAVALGATIWPEGQENDLTDEAKHSIIQRTALKRESHPNYIAQAVWSLIKNEYITGQTLAVDGGRLLF